MEEPPARGRARDALVAAARELLVASRFADIAGFVTVRALTERTGLSNGAVYGAFRSGPASASGLTAPTAAARAALREAVGRPRPPVDPVELAARLAVTAGDPRPRLRSWCSGVVRDRATGDDVDEFTLVLLAGAVAPRDEGVRRELADRYRHQLDREEASSAVALRSWGRRLRDGVTVRDAAALLLAVLEGLALRARAEGRVDDDLAELAGMVVLRGVSTPGDGAAHFDDEEHEGPLRPLAPEQEGAVAAAVRRCYDAGGWAAVVPPAVAAAAGVEPRDLRLAYPQPELLSRHVWSRLAEATTRMAVRVEQLPPAERASWLVHQLAEQVVGHRGAAMAIVRADRGPDLEPGDVLMGSLHPVVELLAATLEEDPAAFGLDASLPPLGPLPRHAAVARFLVGSVFLLAVNRAEVPPEVVADFVLRTCLRPA